MLPPELSKVNVESALAVTPIYPLRPFTLTSHVAVNLPSFVVTVIVVAPNPTAVIVPFETVATLVSLEVHVTVLSVAFSGKTVAIKVSV